MSGITEKVCGDRVTIKWKPGGEDTLGRSVNILDSIEVDSNYRGQGLVRKALKEAEVNLYADIPEEDEEVMAASVTEFLMPAFLDCGWEQFNGVIGWTELANGERYNETRKRNEILVPMMKVVSGK